MISWAAVRPGSLVTIGFFVGLTSGCPQLRPYTCSDDVDCDRAGSIGWCLPDGACIYPSEDCESGWVRSPNAAERPGECDPGPVGGGTGGSTAAATEGISASGVLEGSSSSAGSGVETTASETGNPPACGSLVRIEVATTFLSASEVLEGYPLLLSIEDPAIVGAIAASGEDPVATDDAGVMLPQELERLDEEAGTLALWVRLPAYALGEPLPLQLRWGGGQVPPDPAAAWSERYVGVWHMGDALSGIDGDEIRNSATIGEPGLTEGQMLPEQSVDAVVGRGLRFDGVDDVVLVDAEFVGQLDSYSITFWVLFDGPADAPGDYFQRLNGDYFYPRCWRQAVGAVFCQYIVDDAVTGLSAGLSQDVGQLLHMAVTRDAATGITRLYVDGELENDNEDPVGATLPDDGYAFELGRGELGTLPGMIDEVRVSEQALPETWVRADYRTQLEPGAAIGSMGAIEAAPCG